MEGLERLHQRLLDEILRLGAIAVEPHRVAKQPVDVRHGFGFEREPAAIRVGVGVHRVSRLTFGRSVRTVAVRGGGNSPGWPTRRVSLRRKVADANQSIRGPQIHNPDRPSIYSIRWDARHETDAVGDACLAWPERVTRSKIPRIFDGPPAIRQGQQLSIFMRRTSLRMTITAIVLGAQRVRASALKDRKT